MTYLAKPLSFGMFLKAERRKVHARAENLCFREDTNTSNPVNFHFHVRVAIRVA